MKAMQDQLGFRAGQQVRVVGRSDADRAGADQLGRMLIVAHDATWTQTVQTTDGSLWLSVRDSAWNLRIFDSPYYQPGLRLVAELERGSK